MYPLTVHVLTPGIPELSIILTVDLIPSSHTAGLSLHFHCPLNTFLSYSSKNLLYFLSFPPLMDFKIPFSCSSLCQNVYFGSLTFRETMQCRGLRPKSLCKQQKQHHQQKILLFTFILHVSDTPLPLTIPDLMERETHSPQV